jgi:hypothetical protein
VLQQLAPCPCCHAGSSRLCCSSWRPQSSSRASAAAQRPTPPPLPRLQAARSVQELYKHANTPAIASVLLHKIMRAVRAEGVREGRALLHDWLVVFTADYHRNMMAGAAPKDVLQVCGLWGGERGAAAVLLQAATANLVLQVCMIECRGVDILYVLLLLPLSISPDSADTTAVGLGCM